MPSITDITIGAGATSIIAAVDWKTLGSPVYVQNESDEIITLTISGADTKELDPGEPQNLLPGQIVTGTAVGGAALLQLYQGIIPTNETAAKAMATASTAIIAAIVAGVAAAEPALGSGDDLWSVGKDDFTAVYLSTGSLTLGTFPTSMGTPNDGDFQKVVITRADGSQVTVLPANNTMILTAQVLAVSGTPFLNTDLDYDVFIWGPVKAYDASTASKLATPITIPRPPQDSPQKVGTALGDDTFHEYFDVEQGRIFTNRILDTPGAAGDNTYTLWTSQLNDSTAEGSADYQDRTLELLGQATVTSAEITADPSIGVWTVDGIQAKRIRITCVRANDGANSDGAYQYDMMWS